jgi:hypothetical protein
MFVPVRAKVESSLQSIQSKVLAHVACNALPC